MYPIRYMVSISEIFEQVCESERSYGRNNKRNNIDILLQNLRRSTSKSTIVTTFNEDGKMPPGIIHEILNFFIASLIAIYLFEQNYIWTIPAKLFFGLAILSLMFTPDLDVKSRALNRWGPLKVIWLPFIVTGHRGILHNPVLGALILCFAPGVIMWAKFEDLWVVIGLALSVEIHILSDMIVDDVKRASPF